MCSIICAGDRICGWLVSFVRRRFGPLSELASIYRLAYRMCGIAGYIGSDFETTVSLVRTMSDAMTHRGPDGSGYCVELFGSGWLGLGHRRLSIIDLSALAEQPMETADHTGIIVFNGEIYNFRVLRQELSREGCLFRSSSDTEVLLQGLALHGANFVKRLEGMYAFAYFDRNKKSLLLARDPAGIKPLYFAKQPGSFFFASELLPLLATGRIERKISETSVRALLAYGAVAQPHSLVEGVRMLAPGSTLEVVPKNASYRINDENILWQTPAPTYEGSREDAIETTGRLLDRAVEDHLIADVPVGVFLSAGIDSTLLASLARSHNSGVRAFTVALSQDRDMDEMEIASATARRIGIEHVPVAITEAQAEQAAFEWLTRADQPSIDGLNMFIIAQAVRHHGIKVALSGLGADELFGGYPSFKEVPKLVRFARSFRWLPGKVRGMIAKGIAGRLSAEAVDKLVDMLETSPSIAKYALSRRRLLSNRQLGLLGLYQANPSAESLWLPEDALEQLRNDDVNLGWTISKMEMDFYQKNMLLRDADANSMANSLEVRVPFLDQRLLNWVPSLPDSIRFPKGEASKYLLVQAGKQHLDSIHHRRPKTGFHLPLHRWMLGPMRTLCDDSLEALKDSSLVESVGVDSIWNRFLLDRGLGSCSRALALVTLGAWVRQHRPSFAGVV